jgi:peptidoglycan/xylan/chitin deacetylase (PgdA/CDA1 family)
MDEAFLLSGTPRLEPGQVSLTFDDGPGPRTAELARLLAEQDVPATFFVLGESLEHYLPVLDVVRDCGHAIGLHSETHRPFLSVDLATRQLDRCRARIANYLPETPWFRPPYGFKDLVVPGYAGPVGWNADGKDWDITYRRGQTVEQCVDSIVETLLQLAGGIVVLHDFAPFTEFTGRGLAVADLDLRVVEIAGLLIRRLREHQFTLVGLPDPIAEAIPA